MQGHQNPVRIGTLTWNVLNDNTGRNEAMIARFTFDGGWGPILDPIYDFRWFQIINDHTSPRRPTWNGNQPLPVVDPPAGGWDYQYGNDHVRNGGTRNQRNNGEGADNSPYYENDDDGNTYWFPNFANFHRPNVDSRFEDAPGTSAGQHVLFKTFLVVVRDDLRNTITRGQQEFVKLAGFSWRLDGVALPGGVLQDITKLGQIDPAREKQKIAQALANSGFQGWNTIQLNDFVFVPEPASVIALAVGLMGLAYGRRRRVA
jgi:hypothetical protein